MAEQKRFYWLKLKRDFFKRHDIRIIESMPNGKDYVLFYLKLLCESVDHDGNLRFSESIPYNEDMLATITNTNIDIVRSAVKIFAELNMMELMTDGTYYMSEVAKLIGSAVDSDNANRQRRYRAQKSIEVLQNVTESVTKCNAGVTECVTKNNESKSKSIDKDIDIDKELDTDKDICSNEHTSTRTKPAKPAKHQHGEFKKVLLTDEELEKLVAEYGNDRTEQAIKFFDEYIAEKDYKSKSHYLAMRRWVFKAIEERNGKAAGNAGATNKTAQQLDDFYNMAMEWSRSTESEV